MQANTMLCLDMSKCQFDMENFNIIPIIRTNYHSSVKVRVLSPRGGKGVRGGTRMCSLTSLPHGWDTSGHNISFDVGQFLWSIVTINSDVISYNFEV